MRHSVNGRAFAASGPHCKCAAPCPECKCGPTSAPSRHNFATRDLSANHNEGLAFPPMFLGAQAAPTPMQSTEAPIQSAAMAPMADAP